jgi:hypothetical protein
MRWQDCRERTGRYEKNLFPARERYISVPARAGLPPYIVIAHTREGSLMEDAYIKEEWFYVGEEEKTKLNWFLYESALEYHMFIKGDRYLGTFRKTHGPVKIGEFCTYYAKRMRASVIERLEGKSDATTLYEEYITDFFPRIRRKDMLRLMKVAEAAWESHLSVCVVCPVRCLSEKDRPSDLFGYYGSDV